MLIFLLKKDKIWKNNIYYYKSLVISTKFYWQKIITFVISLHFIKLFGKKVKVIEFICLNNRIMRKIGEILATFSKSVKKMKPKHII